MKLLCVFLLLTLQAFSASAIQIPRVHSWYKTPNYPLEVFEAQGTVLDGKGNEKYITIMGGFRYFPGITTQVYTRRLFTPNAKWERVQDLPVPMTHMAQARNGDLFCGAGGFLGKHPGKSIPQVLCFRQTTRKWFALPNLPGARAGGGMVFYKNETSGEQSLIFAGGVDRLYNSLAKHIDHGTTWKLDLWKKGATWENTGATMPDPRNHMGAVESCGRYFWVGGQHKENEGNGNRKTVSEYIPSQKKWSDNPPAELPVHLGHISASVMPYKCGIMVVGGTSHGVKHQDAIYYWKPTTNKWYKVGAYKHKVATPVCGITGNTLVCGTGGWGNERDKVYAATIGTQNV